MILQRGRKIQHHLLINLILQSGRKIKHQLLTNLNNKI